MLQQGNYGAAYGRNDMGRTLALYTSCSLATFTNVTNTLASKARVLITLQQLRNPTNSFVISNEFVTSPSLETVQPTNSFVISNEFVTSPSLETVQPQRHISCRTGQQMKMIPPRQVGTCQSAARGAAHQAASG